MQNECPIMLPVGASMLVGSIDLITWFGSRALIVDYKTGGGDLDADAARARYALQAGCYALAALAAGATEVGVVFVEVEREGRETRFAFSGPDAPALRGPIDDALEEMAAGRFPSLAEYDPRVCAECPALGATCPITPPGGPAA
jgi:hypothetical protein